MRSREKSGVLVVRVRVVLRGLSRRPSAIFVPSQQQRGRGTTGAGRAGEGGRGMWLLDGQTSTYNYR